MINHNRLKTMWVCGTCSQVLAPNDFISGNHPDDCGENVKDETNPKDLLGVKKVSTAVFPAVALLHGSHAMMNGAEKYGPYNWREKQVRASIYLDACERHLLAWREREETAEDSGVHHLGHAMACLAILLDAQATGNLADDRPRNGEGFLKALTDLNITLANRK